MTIRSSLGRTMIAGVASAMLMVGPASAKTVLKVWTIPWSDVAHAAFKSVIAEFEAQHPDIVIKEETRGIDEHKAAMRVAVNSGVGPDIYFMWGGLGLGGEFVNAGASAPLDAAYAKYHWDQRFVPAALDDTRRYKGQRHGVPFVIHGEGLYYNKALFARAGIKTLPQSYDELVADAQKLKTAGIPAIVFGGSVNWHLMRLMDEILEVKCGAEKHDALMAMKLDWSKEPCTTASFTELKRWADDFMLKPFMGLADDQAQGLFYAGRVAMALEGDWFVNMVATHGNLANTGLFLFPTGTDRLYFFSEQFYVGAKSEHKEAAIEFLNFLTSPAEQQKYLGKFASTSVDKNIDYSTDHVALDHVWYKLISGAKGSFANGDQAFPVDVTTEYWRIIDQVASDNMSPQAAAVGMQTFIAHRKQ